MRRHAGRLRWTMAECNATTGLLNMARLSWRCARAAPHGDHYIHFLIFFLTHRQTLLMVVWFLVTIILGFSASNTTKQAQVMDGNFLSFFCFLFCFDAALHCVCPVSCGVTLDGTGIWLKIRYGQKGKENTPNNQCDSAIAFWAGNSAAQYASFCQQSRGARFAVNRAKPPLSLSRRKLMLRRFTSLKSCLNGWSRSGGIVAGPSIQRKDDSFPCANFRCHD